MKAEKNRIEDIEVLRAVAILFTLGIHLLYLFPWWAADVPSIYRHFDFRVGVDLFFVISGFVIASTSLPRLRAAIDSARFWRTAYAFWVRRAWRIWPLAWLWIILIVLATKTLNVSGSSPEVLRSTLPEALASVLQVMNLWFAEALTAHPHLPLPSNQPFAVYWSLSLEEQFYLVFPLAVLILRKRLALALLLIAGAMFFVPKPIGSPVWFLRFDPIAVGVLLAIWRTHSSYRLLEPRFLAVSRWGCAIFVVLLSLLAAAAMNMSTVFFAHGLAELCCAVLVYAASFGKDYFLPRGAFRAILLWIGSRSYAIYVCHLLLFRVAAELWLRASSLGAVFDSSSTLPFGLTALCLVGLAAELSHRLVEKPLRELGRKHAARIEGTPEKKPMLAFDK